MLTLLGLTGEAKRKAIRSTTEASEKATRWLWIKRADLWANSTGTHVGVCVINPGRVAWARVSDVERLWNTQCPQAASLMMCPSASAKCIFHLIFSHMKHIHSKEGSDTRLKWPMSLEALYSLLRGQYICKNLYFNEWLPWIRCVKLYSKF